VDPAENPFFGLPMFGEMAKAMSGQGPLNWDAARQFAAVATGSSGSDANPDPIQRIRLHELARIVEMHVHDITGLDTVFPELTPVSAGAWAQRTLDAYRPLFTELASSLSSGVDTAEVEVADPMMAMIANLSRMMAPAMLGMAVGSMVGRMASRMFGQYDLPIPRNEHGLLVITSNIDAFAADWSLPADEVRLWVIAQEYIGHTLLSIPSVRDGLSTLVRRYVGAFRPDSSSLADHIEHLDLGEGDPMAAMQQLLGDPAVMLGAVQSPEQAALAPALDAAVAAVIGAVDYLVDSVAVRVIGGEALRIAEAVRRRRLEHSPDDVFVERLLGLQLSQAQVQRGKDFIAGVVDRAGEPAITELFDLPDSLPTPAELDAPGLWIARLGR
jgi:putative hydrolase